MIVVCDGVPWLVPACGLEDTTFELVDEVELRVVDVLDVCAGVVDELDVVVVEGVLVVVVVVVGGVKILQ